MSVIELNNHTAHQSRFVPNFVTSDLPTISIFGLGYVGAVSAACFCNIGHEVIGVDMDPRKVELIEQGESPIVENGLDDLLARANSFNLLSATSDCSHAIANSDISFISVGTPSKTDGGCDTRYLEAVSKQIGRALALKDDYHLVMFRSTVPPRTTRDVMVPILEAASGKKAGVDFGVCFNPEFLRESTAIDDFYEPPKTVIGATDEMAAEVAASLYRDKVSGEIIITDLEVAEFVKYVDNTWHALKVVFGNEIGRVCKALDVDSHKVMDIFCKDRKLNLSPYYLKPGFAYGGSCLPKDTRGINSLANKAGVEVPVLASIADSNNTHIDHAVELISEQGCRRIGVLGVTFKAGTDDLRESPAIELISRLEGLGHEVMIFDPNLVSAPLHDTDYTQDKSAEVASRLGSMNTATAEDLTAFADVLVVANGDKTFAPVVKGASLSMPVLDLVRIVEYGKGPGYEGICW